MAVKPSIYCRRGHKKTGKNLILRHRVNQKTHKVEIVKECRTCSNDSLRARREARKRNAALLKGEEQKPLECDWCGDRFTTDSYDLEDGRVFCSEMCRAQGESGRQM